ncbi:MAG: xanthine dehydrogenase family protein subunit M [Peptococcaceae bacterium]|nr:xanthine dehydrogenase family protein subunit M [Peptococcaceae bacterium]MDH7524810.1 xanthine dehydrogenase family protein subunit M [Peptococcaceae bacterium]
MSKFKYLQVESLPEAFSILDEYGKSAALLAGGTDLLINIKEGKIMPRAVIPLKRIRALAGRITPENEGLTIGALATLSEVAANETVRARYTALAEAAGKIGSRQVRNWATIGGNICNASPAADTVPALLLFDAEINITGKRGQRAVPAAAFFLGPGKTDLREGEIVESIFLPAPPPECGSCYLKLGRREGVDLAIVGAAALVSRAGEVRIAVGAAGPTAFRATGAEKLLAGRAGSAEALEKALPEVSGQARPITDIRASREYRLAMVEVLTRRALETAGDRLKQKE